MRRLGRRRSNVTFRNSYRASWYTRGLELFLLKLRAECARRVAILGFFVVCQGKRVGWKNQSMELLAAVYFPFHLAVLELGGPLAREREIAFLLSIPDVLWLFHSFFQFFFPFRARLLFPAYNIVEKREK